MEQTDTRNCPWSCFADLKEILRVWNSKGKFGILVFLPNGNILGAACMFFTHVMGSFWSVVAQNAFIVFCRKKVAARRIVLPAPLSLLCFRCACVESVKLHAVEQREIKEQVSFARFWVFEHFPCQNFCHRTLHGCEAFAVFSLMLPCLFKHTTTCRSSCSLSLSLSLSLSISLSLSLSLCMSVAHNKQLKFTKVQFVASKLHQQQEEKGSVCVTLQFIHFTSPSTSNQGQRWRHLIWHCTVCICAGTCQVPLHVHKWQGWSVRLKEFETAPLPQEEVLFPLCE